MITRSCKIFHLLWLGALLLSLSGSALALNVPSLTARVNDLAAMLSPATARQLEQSLQSFEQRDSTQIVVLTVPSLEGDSLEDFATRVFEAWKLGQKGRDNGVLLLIAKNDRKIRIEVGYGLEGRLTDLLAGRIIRDVIAPRFKSGNFDQGVLDGVNAIMGAIKGEFTADNLRKSHSSANSRDFLMFLLFGLFVIGRLLASNRIIAGTAGGIFAPVLGHYMLSMAWPAALVLIPFGFIVGLVLASLGGSSMGRHSSGYSGPFISMGGGDSSSGGGFDGGGGGSGGGGASGGW